MGYSGSSSEILDARCICLSLGLLDYLNSRKISNLQFFLLLFLLLKKALHRQFL